jgi:hypothetical protein
MDTPKKAREEMQDEIIQFLDERRETVRLLLNNAADVSSLIPSWKPEQGIEFGDKDSRANVLQLAIPAVNQIPSLLLHDMGEQRAHLAQEQAARISRVFSFSNHKCVHDVE